MNQSGTPSDFEAATRSSAVGNMGRRAIAGLTFISVVGALVAPGTTAGVLIDLSRLRPIATKTDAGQIEAEGVEQAATLGELRRLTGLTWEKIADLFGVSRRAVHFWASGKPMDAPHQEHLQRSLGCIKVVDRGNAPANREALFAANTVGVAPFDLLESRKYQEFVASMGYSASQSHTLLKPTRVSNDRRPLPTQTLISAREEPAHREVGAPRRARVVKV